MGDEPRAGNRTANFGTQETISGGNGTGGFEHNSLGRFPANFIHDGSDEVLELFEGHWAKQKVLVILVMANLNILVGREQI